TVDLGPFVTTTGCAGYGFPALTQTPRPERGRSMKYLCLLYGNQEKVGRLSKEEFSALVERCKKYDEELRGTGAVRMVESLEWDVTTIRPQNGKPTVMDGPFVETRDVVGSVMIIEARD